MRKLLRNKAYRGIVVDDQRWDRVKRLLDGAPDTRARIHPWPLSGALHCSCGRILVGSMRGAGRRVYRCMAVTHHKKALSFSALDLEAQFKALLHSLSISQKSINAYVKQTSKLLEIDQTTLQNRRTVAQETIRNANKERARVWKLNADGFLKDAHLASRLNQIDDSILQSEGLITEIHAEMQRVDADKEASEHARFLVAKAATLWENADVTDQAAAARALARAFQGLCVLENGSLEVGPPKEWSRFFKADQHGKHLSKS